MYDLSACGGSRNTHRPRQVSDAVLAPTSNERRPSRIATRVFLLAMTVTASPAARWRPMSAADLPTVHAVAQQVHPGYFERPVVFAERLRLHADGCMVLADDGGVIGYVLSHPWKHGEPPSLDTLLGALPGQPDTYYLHDLALLPAARGTGAAAAVIAHLRAHARRCGQARLSLVAVNASVPFWQRQGFEVVAIPGLDACLANYDAAACFMAASLVPDR
jgi:ribosomal protein S18 acetylase RimI-like enzyme